MLLSNFRHIREEGHPIWLPSSVETFISDLMVLLAGGAAVPVSEVAWDTDLLTTQKLAKAAFLGAANDQVKTADVGDTMSIATEGVHRYPMADIGTTADAIVGDYVSFAENAAGDGLEPQEVVVVDDVLAAIGMIVERESTTSVLIRIFGMTAIPV